MQGEHQGRDTIRNYPKPLTEPELVAKITDAIGLYLAPPENAAVLHVN